MRHSIIIFDLDGTLLDTLDDLADTGNQVLASYGFPVHPVQSYKYFVGDGMRTLVERIIPAGTAKAEVDGCFELFKTIYGERWQLKTRPYDGIVGLIDRLREIGYRLCILSNKPHDFTLKCVGHYFPDKPFELVFGQRADVAKKPDPAGALEIAELLGATPGDCIYVGDTMVDMQTGKSAGMFTIGVLWGFRDVRELQENGADRIVAGPAELAEAIVGLNA